MSDSTEQPQSTNDGIEDSGSSLAVLALYALVGIAGIMLASFAATAWWSRDHFVVDFYPGSEERSPTVVIRWPSRGQQLEPVELPRMLGNQWEGKQPKRAKLAPDTILPAGEVVSYDDSEPPGRYTIRLAGREFDVSPESDWYTGARPLP